MLALVLIYLILGCSVAPWLFWPCKFCKCVCKCLPGVNALCDEDPYSSPDSESSDDEETRRERRRRRGEREGRPKKKKKKKKARTREREMDGGTGGAGGEKWRVVERAMAKGDASLDSEITGSLEAGKVIRSLERRRNSTGQERVRCSKGWVSVVAQDGSVLLERVGPASNASRAADAVDDLQAQVQSEWEEKYSEQHGRPYWVNRATRKSTWEDPIKAATAERAQRTRLATEAGIEIETAQPAQRAGGRGGGRGVGGGGGAAGGLPQGWVQKEHNGRPYFVNSSTGEKSWTRPAGGAAAGGGQAQAQSPWVEKYSEQHQRPYWVHRETRKSVWTNPNSSQGGGGGGGRGRATAAAAGQGRGRGRGGAAGGVRNRGRPGRPAQGQTAEMEL